jgi:hypothetical protein
MCSLITESLVFKKGNSTSAQPAIENGSIVIHKDTGDMFVDSDNKRTQIKDSTKVSKSGDTVEGDLNVTGTFNSSNFREILDGEELPETAENGAIFLVRSNDSLSIFDRIYPVGSIYMSANNTDPSLLFGGTWERIEDSFLLAAGSTYGAGTTGGEARHTLTENEMPSHYHSGLYWARPSGEPLTLNSGGADSHLINATWSQGLAGSPFYTGEAGGSQPHNNMPPYLAVYMWKRLTLSNGSY